MQHNDTLRRDIPVTVKQVAILAGVSTRAMREMLLRCRCTEEGILIKPNRHWVVTSINDLRRVWPSFARQVVDEDSLTDIRVDIEVLKKRLTIHEQGIKAFKARANSWFRRVEKVEDKSAVRRHKTGPR